MNSNIEIISKTVRAYTEDGLKIVAFGDDTSSPENYFILSRYDDPSAGENAQIDDMIGIQTSQSDYEVTGAISRIAINSSMISVLIIDEKIDEVGTKKLTAKFELSKNERDELRMYLREICNGSKISLVEL